MLAVRASHAFDGRRVWAGGAVVLVEGGHIVGVERPGVEIPAGATLIDVPDGTILPGLVNAHVHLCGDSENGALERLPEQSPAHVRSVIETSLGHQLAAGVTTVRDLGCAHWAVVERRDRAVAGDAEPHIVASGPPITSIGGHCWMMGGAVAGIGALRAAVAERAERAVDVVKVMASGGAMTPGTDMTSCQFTLDELRCVVDESHHRGLAVTAHAHARTAVEQAIEAGVDGIEHCTCLTDEGFDFSRDVMARLRARDIVVCPTLGLAIDAVRTPALVAIQLRFGLNPERRQQLVAEAHAAGVRIISGDDAGISRGKRHGIFAESVLALHAGGVGIADALASATSVSAEAIGIGSHTGRLAAGLDADVLVVRGDATTDLSALRDVAVVIVGGTVAVGDA
jgi:imidazolonepropionase-like amidohydrolase